MSYPSIFVLMWRIGLRYGGLMGVLMLVYIVLEWSWVAIPDERSIALFGVALLFTSFGVWGGLKLSKPRSNPSSIPETDKRTIIKQLDLRPREMEILEQMSAGLSNQEIADNLHLSLNTIKTHNQNLFVKLDVKRRTQAVNKARELGLIESSH